MNEFRKLTSMIPYFLSKALSLVLYRAFHQNSIPDIVSLRQDGFHSWAGLFHETSLTVPTAPHQEFPQHVFPDAAFYSLVNRFSQILLRILPQVLPHIATTLMYCCKTGHPDNSSWFFLGIWFYSCFKGLTDARPVNKMEICVRESFPCCHVSVIGGISINRMAVWRAGGPGQKRWGQRVHAASREK